MEGYKGSCALYNQYGVSASTANKQFKTKNDVQYKNLIVQNIVVYHMQLLIIKYYKLKKKTLKS